MDVTSQLVRVYQVERQIRGLKSRLDSADKFLAEQNKELQQVDTKKSALDAQMKALTAQALNHEGEMKRLDARMATIREQMNTAQTNKQYQAFLLEMNNFKADRDKMETAALEVMAKVDELKKQVAEFDDARGQRLQVQRVASTERDTRFKEIEARLKELEEQRRSLAENVPAESLAVLTRLLQQRGEEAMATVQVEDRKRHEYTCGSCQMTIPMEAVSSLLARGVLTRCVSCQCILYLDEDAAKALQPASSKR